jgi:hypothetical protein
MALAMADGVITSVEGDFDMHVNFQVLLDDSLSSSQEWN